MTTPNTGDKGTNTGGTPNVPGQGTPGGTPAPQNQGAQGGQPANQDQGKTVPITALHEERDKRQSLQTELDQLKKVVEGYTKNPVPPNPYQQPQPQYGYQQPQQQQGFGYMPQPPADSVQRLEQMWEQDPVKAFRTEMAAALQWRDWVETKTDTQIDAAKSRYTDFDKYETQVRRYIRQMPLEQRAGEAIVDAAYYIVKGQNADNIVKAREAEILEKIKRGEQVQGFQYGGSGTPSPDGDKYTADEAKAAEAMGVPIAEYMKARKPR
jgi:GH24 family phage-related lysozyme (muramidase)